MSRSAKGTVEQPGKSVRQKAALHRAMLDQGWDEFRRLLAYKMEWNGGTLLAALPYHTSQTLRLLLANLNRHPINKLQSSAPAPVP